MRLVIGNKSYSSWSLRAWLPLRHLNVPFEEERIALFEPGYKAWRTAALAETEIIAEDEPYR